MIHSGRLNRVRSIHTPIRAKAERPINLRVFEAINYEKVLRSPDCRERPSARMSSGPADNYLKKYEYANASAEDSGQRLPGSVARSGGSWALRGPERVAADQHPQRVSERSPDGHRDA